MEASTVTSSTSHSTTVFTNDNDELHILYLQRIQFFIFHRFLLHNYPNTLLTLFSYIAYSRYSHQKCSGEKFFEEIKIFVFDAC